MANFKASYISVLNHWKTFETTLTTESNNLPAKLALPYPPTSSLINNLILIFDARICKSIEVLTNFLL